MVFWIWWILRRLARFYLFLVVAACPVSIAHASEHGDKVSVGPEAAWVVHQEADLSASLSTHQNVSYLLMDDQTRFTESDDERFIHTVKKLNTPAGVEGHSNISIDFDPAFEKVVIHQLRVHRDGQELDMLRSAKFDIFRTEEDSYRLIFNGTMRVSYFIPGVHVGDILEFSYTVSGRNPALGPHFYENFQHQFSVPVQKLYQRLTLPKNLSYQKKDHGSVKDAKVEEAGGYKSFTWDIKNVPASLPESRIPSWYYDYPTTEFSSFSDWNHVGVYFSQYYAVPDDPPPEIKKLAAEISSKQQFSQTRVRAALDYVQREIRYLGIEIGEGGYKPRSPLVVLKDRFGDCKDQALLLLYLLKALGYPGKPVLVSSLYKGHFEEVIPSYGAFNHVIVGVSVGGRDYYLDPTMGVQLGSLDNMQQAHYGRGLELLPESRGAIDVKPQLPNFYINITDRYNLTRDPESVSFENQTTFIRGEADSIISWYKSSGLESIEKYYLEYYQDIYPGLIQAKPSEIVIQEYESSVSLTNYYTIKSAWTIDADRQEEIIDLYAADIEDNFLSFSGEQRTFPYWIKHPVLVHQKLIVTLDDSWSLKDEDYSVYTQAFDFKKKATYRGATYVEEYEYKTKADFINTRHFQNAMRQVKESREQLGVRLYRPHKTDQAKRQEKRSYEWVLDHLEEIFIGWFTLAIFLAFIVGILRLNADFEWRSELVLYPVSLGKFIPLSVITFGIYNVYWIYKNWQWLRDIDGQDISPGTRAFFAPLFNFDLFTRIASMKPQGYAWYEYTAALWALLYLVGEILDRVWGDLDEAPGWLGLLTLFSPLFMVPVAAQINKMNEGRKIYIQRNSYYGWEAAGLIFLFLPLFLVVLAACFIE